MKRTQSQKYFATMTLGAWMAFMIACTEQPKQKDIATANAVTASSAGVMAKSSSSSAQITLSAEEGSEVPDTALQLAQLEVVADTVSYGSGKFCFEGRGENIDLLNYQNDIEKLLVDSEIPENSRLKELRLELSPNLDKDLILGNERCALRARDHQDKIIVKVDHDLRIDSAKAYLLRLKYKFEKRHDEHGRCHAQIKVRLDSIEKRKSECEKEEKLSEHRRRGEHQHRHHFSLPANFHGKSECRRQDSEHASDKRKQYGPLGHIHKHDGHHDDDHDADEVEESSEDVCQPIEVITPPAPMPTPVPSPNPSPAPAPAPAPGPTPMPEPVPMPPVPVDPAVPVTPTTPVDSTTTTTMGLPAPAPSPTPMPPTAPVDTTTSSQGVPSVPTTPVSPTTTTTTMPVSNPLPAPSFDTFF